MSLSYPGWKFRRTTLKLEQLAGNMARLTPTALNTAAGAYLATRMLYNLQYVLGGSTRQFFSLSSSGLATCPALLAVLADCVCLSILNSANPLRSIAMAGHLRSVLYFSGIASCFTLFIQAGNRFSSTYVGL